MNRKRLILFVLVILLAVASIWSYTAMPRPKTVATLKYAPGQQAQQAAPARPASRSAEDDGRILRIALLDQEMPSFSGYRRNIFRPIFVDERKLLKQKAAAFKPPQQPVLPQKPVEQVSKQAPSQPEAASLARFTFLGFLKKDNRKTIFLARDKDIILVKKGSKFAGRYEAASITDQALTILVTDTGDEIVIPLIENRPLGASK